MNEEKYTLIHDFFNGQLDETERQQVLRMVEEDPVFADAFHLHDAMEKWPAAEQRRKKLEQQLAPLGDEFFTNATVEKTTAPTPVMQVSYTRWAAIAAAMALLLVAVWFVLRPSSPQYAQYAAHEPLHITTRGNDAAEINAAEQAFNTKNYSLALEKIRVVRQSQPGDLTLQITEAICLIELGKGAEARNIMAPIASGNSALRSEAVWYTGLSYLKEGNEESCKKTMQAIPADDFRYKDAQEILNNL